MTTPLLCVTELSRRFGALQAVEAVSFSLGGGERLALIGPNGAGKTTLFNLLMGQLRADRGRVHLAGREVTGVGPARLWRQGVGRTFQIPAVFTSMTVAENVQTALVSAAGRSFNPWARAWRLERDTALALLAEVGLQAAADRAAAILAYGDVKRLELAVALAHRPRLLLLDEPTAGMAAAERRQMMDLIDRLVRERGLSVLFTEHDMEAVFAHADRILVLHRGRLIADAAPAAVATDAEVRAVYLGRRPVAAAAATP